MAVTPGGFSAQWLALREPFDAAARQRAWSGLAAATRWTRPDHLPSDRTLSIADLACGTGSNLRFLAPRLGGTQHWRVVDHDASLLEALPRMTEHWANRHGYGVTARGSTVRIEGPTFRADVEALRIDLVNDLARVPFTDAQLVTASALLDLVSKQWLAQLVAHSRAAGADVYCALTYNGRITWRPSDDLDDVVLQAFNRHQQTDKGFGPALGPSAGDEAIMLLRGAGYRVISANSDWRIESRDVALRRSLIEDWAEAAASVYPQRRAGIEGWRRRRCNAHGGAEVEIGHVEIVASAI